MGQSSGGGCSGQSGAMGAPLPQARKDESKPSEDQLSGLGCGPRANVRNDRIEEDSLDFTFSDPN